MVAASVSLESLCVNSIRMLAVDAVNKSNSGHPGLPMGCAPMGYALWQNILNHNPTNPNGSTETVLYYQLVMAVCFYIPCFI